LTHCDNHLHEHQTQGKCRSYEKAKERGNIRSAVITLTGQDIARAEYGRMRDALAIAKEQASMKNTATAFGLLLDLVERTMSQPHRTADELLRRPRMVVES
jgi:hypothetical protein